MTRGLLALAVGFGAAAVSGGSLSDYPRLAGETDDSGRLQRAIDANPSGTVQVPAGEYRLASMVSVTNLCSLALDKSAVVRAVREMPFVIRINVQPLFDALPRGDRRHDYNLFVRGGKIDGNFTNGRHADTAKIGFDIAGETRLFGCSYYANPSFRLDDITVIRHRGGTLLVSGCSFAKTSARQKNYEGIGPVRFADMTYSGYAPGDWCPGALEPTPVDASALPATGLRYGRIKADGSRETGVRYLTGNMWPFNRGEVSYYKGYLTVPETGWYEFRIKFACSPRIVLGGEVLFEGKNGTRWEFGEPVARRRLEKGKDYPIAVRVAPNDNYDQSAFGIQWRSAADESALPSAPWTGIPFDCLRHEKTTRDK